MVASEWPHTYTLIDPGTRGYANNIQYLTQGNPYTCHPLSFGYTQTGGQRSPSTRQTMATNDTARDGEGRYGSFETDDGDVVFYDRDNPDAWLQAATVTIED